MRWIASFAATLVAMLTLQMSSLGFAPLIPAIQHQFGVSYSEIGLFTGLYGIIGLLLSYPAGLLAKQYGEKAVLAAGLIIVAAGLIGLGAAPTFGLALAARVLWLVGYQLAFVSVFTAVTLTAPASFRGSSLGLLGSVAAAASVIGAPFGSRIGQAMGWRLGIVAYGAVALFGAVVILLFYTPAATSHVLASERSGAGPGQVPTPAFRLPVVWALAALLGCCNAGGFSSTFFVPSALLSKFGLHAVQSAYVISGAYLLAIAANLLCGFLIDRFDRWAVMKLFLATIVVSTVAMTSGNLLGFRIAVSLVIACGLACASQVYGIAADVVPGRETGPVMGIVSIGAGVFGYIGPQSLGSLRDWTGGFNAGWWAMAFLASIALLTVFYLRTRVGVALRSR